MEGTYELRRPGSGELLGRFTVTAEGTIADLTLDWDVTPLGPRITWCHACQEVTRQTRIDVRPARPGYVPQAMTVTCCLRCGTLSTVQ